MKKLLYILLIMTISQNCFGQVSTTNTNDKTLERKALNYLNSKFGPAFVEEHLELSKFKSEQGGIIIFDLKKKIASNRSSILVTFKTAYEGAIRTLAIDTTVTLPNKNQILDCELSKKNCHLLINRDGAIAIAKKTGFTKKNPVYTTNIVLYGSDAVPTWNLISPDEIIDNYHSKAQGISINAVTGEYKLFTVNTIE